jgi:small subunit ribosomal protein S21
LISKQIQMLRADNGIPADHDLNMDIPWRRSRARPAASPGVAFGPRCAKKRAPICAKGSKSLELAGQFVPIPLYAHTSTGASGRPFFVPDILSGAAFGRRLAKKEACVQVLVRDNNIDQALKALKKKMQREGIFREMKLRGHYEKPSEKRAREKAEAVRRARKLARKKLQREGLLPMKPRPTMGGR